MGQYYRTIHDVNDGFGGTTGSCREFKLPRDDQDSEPIGWIRGHTRIGPVRQVRVTCCLDQHGIDFQVPSTSTNGSCSWIVISRGPNRFVDESGHDQEDPPQDVEMVCSASVEKSHAVKSSIEKTHAPKQQALSSIPMNYPSKQFIQIDKRKWNDIPACDNFEKYSLAF